MSNLRLKDHTWDAANVYDSALGKTQEQINAEVGTSLAGKQATLVSGENIKTINGTSILGSGNIEIQGGGSVTVDDELSDSSENPVQNKVITGEVNSIKNAVDDLLYEFTPISVNLTANKVIASNGTIASGSGSGYVLSDKITVAAGETYRLTAKMNYGNYVYALYNTSNSIVGGVKAATGGTWTKLTNELITIPDGVTGLRFGGYNNYGPTLEKKTPINLNKKQWDGKKWAAIGDSLTEANSTASKKYHALIAEKTGITVLNYGKSGTGYGKTYSDFNNFADRVSELANVDCDVITIFGSFNDLSLELGTADDTGTSTLGGYMNTTFDNLFTAKPFVSVGVITPTPWWGKTPGGTSENSVKAQDYCEMLIEICNRRSIPVLDLFHRSNLHPDDSGYRDEFYADADGVHPNNKGHAKIAPMIYEFLTELIELS